MVHIMIGLMDIEQQAPCLHYKSLTWVWHLECSTSSPRPTRPVTLASRSKAWQEQLWQEHRLANLSNLLWF